jgi:hypothetical protein
MSLLRLPTPGLDLQGSLTTTQVPIAGGASGTFANSGNLCTITTTAAHGLTLTPSAGVMPNYYVTFSGVTAQTGVGSLNSNIFRILSIPSTTTFTIYSTVTAATITAATIIPVFYPIFIAANGSSFAGGPTQTISAVVTPFPPAQLAGASFYAVLGANCTVQAALGNPVQTILLLDALTTPTTGTPTSPTWTAVQPASSAELMWAAPPNIALWASGGAGTSTIACIN